MLSLVRISITLSVLRFEWY